MADTPQPRIAQSPVHQERLRTRLSSVADFLLKQRHLCAVRDGVVAALPLVLIGSLFLLAAQPPSAGLQRLLAPYAPALLVPYRVLSGAIALYVTFSAAYSLAKSYGLDPLSSGLLAMAAYLTAAAPSPQFLSPGDAGTSLPLERLGAGGIFAGLALAIGTVELTRFFVARRWIIQLPRSAPEIVVRSFMALIPGLTVIVAVFWVTQVLKVDIIHQLETLVRPLMRATGTLPAVLAVVCLDSGLWLLGVHASAASAPLRPLWQAMLIQNMDALAHGSHPLPHIATLPFYLWFVWQGGSGTSLALGLLLLRARSAQLRGVGRVGLLPVICNINEPVLFGAPVVLNAHLAIPFFGAPLLTAILSYVAFHFDWVTRPYLEMPWTLPAPVGAFFATGGDWRAVILQLVNLSIGLLIYWPFVRRYDRRLLKGEDAASAPGSAATLPSPLQSP